MRKLLITVISSVVFALVAIGVGGCETATDEERHKYPPADESVRPNSVIPQAGTDFLDDE